METLDIVLAQLAPTHARLTQGLLSKGLTYNGCTHRDGKLRLELKSGCSQVIINSNGNIELITENINPYEPYDTGYHNWTVCPEDTPKEVDAMINIIARITGDD